MFLAVQLLEYPKPCGDAANTNKRGQRNEFSGNKGNIPDIISQQPSHQPVTEIKDLLRLKLNRRL